MIYTSNFILTGTFSNMPVYTNSLSAAGYSNISFESDVKVQGRVDVAKATYATFKLGSNIQFNNTNEIYGLSNVHLCDCECSDLNCIENSNCTVYDDATGCISVPLTGLYSFEMQGVFQNQQPNAQNGVYLKLLNQTCSNARIAACINNGSVISTSHMTYFKAGDRVLPVYYSSDSNATLVADDEETYVSFVVTATMTPQ